MYLAFGVDGQRFGGHPAIGHVSCADAVGVQHGLIQRITAAHLNPQGALVPLGQSRSAARRRHRLRAVAQCAQRYGGLNPSRAPDGHRGWRSGNVNLFHHEGGSDRTDGVGNPRGADHPNRPATISVDPDGDRRAFGSVSNGVFARPQHPDGTAMLIGQPAGHSRQRRRRLGPERAAVGQGTGRLAAGHTPRGVGLQVGGLHP